MTQLLELLEDLIVTRVIYNPSSFILLPTQTFSFPCNKWLLKIDCIILNCVPTVHISSSTPCNMVLVDNIGWQAECLGTTLVGPDMYPFHSMISLIHIDIVPSGLFCDPAVSGRFILLLVLSILPIPNHSRSTCPVAHGAYELHARPYMPTNYVTTPGLLDPQPGENCGSFPSRPVFSFLFAPSQMCHPSNVEAATVPLTFLSSSRILVDPGTRKSITMHGDSNWWIFCSLWPEYFLPCEAAAPSTSRRQ